MTAKQRPYEEHKHELDTKMLQAGNLQTEQERKQFVTDTFLEIHQKKQDKQINQQSYVKLINRLAAYANGAFNDYLDMLAGAAQMDLLDIAIQGGPQFTVEQTRKQRDAVTRLTGMQPHKPDTEEQKG